MKMTTIPLFPLPMVVLPGEPMLLHIFEDRYREMLRDVRANVEQGEFADFGIALSNDEGKHVGVGTTVALTEVFEEFEDGRMNIMVTGRHRFQVVGKDKTGPYDRAEVIFLEDDEADWDDEKANRAFQLHREISKLVLGAYPADELYDGKAHPSYMLAQSVGLPLEVKQKLIEQSIEDERLELLGDYFEILLPEMERIENIKAQARENWSMQEHLRNKAT